MKPKFYINKILISGLLLYTFFHISYAQDSLYLIGTITGESTEQRIDVAVRIGDVNGDGYDDFVISMRTGNTTSDQAVVKLYLGSANYDLNTDVIFHYPGSDSLNDFGGRYGIGDINADGYNEFVLTGVFGDWVFPKGKVFLYYGGEIIDTIPVNEFYQPNAIQDFFGETNSMGDINNDGYDDFVISSPYNWTDGKGYVYLFWGGDTISWNNSITFTSDTLEDFFGSSVESIGDINQDGFNDIAIGAIGGPSGYDTSKIYIYYGGFQMDNAPDTMLISNELGDYFGEIIKNAGDLNGDGRIDFCISKGQDILIYTFGLENPLRINSGYSLDAGSDINKDGYDDILIGDDWKIKIYLGSEPFDTTYDLIIVDIDSIGFAPYISFAGDINNDRYDEIFAYAPNYPDTENPVGKVFIYSYNKISEVKDEIDNAPNNFFLSHNYPNPFNPSTTLSFVIGHQSLVSLKIYDILGREITTLVNEEKPSGIYEIEFNATNLSSGIYFYQLQAGNFISTKKLVLLK
ncbi:MAG: T9SS type A sorting domain-containing protein [Ignavibacteriota bacterium]|jgi:hypothetical protein|nr:MAG: T9SS C-terminal target domain-containing protein [Chlorobiota bacterium]MBE7477423.1 FG-GAP repeat protein [Ignavibacteriales bacterium]MBL1122825.1 T9SS C-terminal target domain-containing protein [Ignavibacteriota bacterium]MCC7095545.1 FG-GAP repeat protein [Ignavibacteriaceae bacterium]MCE7857383.1 T9SS C-terminal target domain-containing protein [Ignavibacteria bacterium CHB3]MEB2296892.1 T9SS type A sorting domain-containing protein [Ignavibacteria bacterium]